jgi:CRISPR-associated endonuclease Csn1
MGKTILGVDLGITSIGWAVVNVDTEEKEKSAVIDAGVRIFTIAEHPKDGSSLAAPRREARSMRRVTKRRAKRVERVKRLLIGQGLVTAQSYGALFEGKLTDIWQLRKEGLERVLSDEELARIMVHMAKHRGYQSMRKAEEGKDSEGGKVLRGIEANTAAMEKKGFETIGAYLHTQERKRNRNADYSNSINRDMLRDEIALIFKRQKEFGNGNADDALLQRFTELSFEQKPLKSVAEMVGNCPFEPAEKRAPKNSFTFERFRALQTLANLRLMTPEGETALDTEEIGKIFDEALNTKVVKYSKVRKVLGLDDAVEFKGLVYYDHRTGEVAAKNPENAKVAELAGYHRLKKAVSDADKTAWEKMRQDAQLLDDIAVILSVEKDDEAIRASLRRHLDSDELIGALLTVSFSQFGHLSLKALQRITPFLERGMRYDEACGAAGYDFKVGFGGVKGRFLPPLGKEETEQLTNPVVKRAIAQFRKVFNALVRKHGDFDAVHIELTRDIKKSHKDRMEIKKGQDEFRAEKERVAAEFSNTFGREPTGKELLKFRLYKEQLGRCIYSGESLEPKRLLETGYTEVDHVLPYSRSLDDSLNNKVLCLGRENQKKGNKTPFEYFGSDRENEAWQAFEGRVRGLKTLRRAKRDRLLKRNFDENSENAFKERNKSDTSYISRFVKNYIEAHIDFGSNKLPVQTRNGMLTSQLRFKWGVGDKNRGSHLHHAEDAAIVAFSTQSEVQRLSTVAAQREGMVYETKEEKAKKVRFTPPYETFNDDLRRNVNGIFVSFTPRKKVTGAAHKETVYSDKTLMTKKPDGRRDELKGNSRMYHVKLKHGIALNDEMPRVDVFRHTESGKYFLVPIYVGDFVKEEIPNKAIVQSKPWVEMDDAYDFQFSLFKNELIEVKQKNKEPVLGYFQGIDSSTAKVLLTAHSGDQKWGIGSKSLEWFKKFQVDLLGEYVEVKQEKRQGSIKTDWDKKLEKRRELRKERKRRG